MKRVHIVHPYESAAMLRMTKPLNDYLSMIYEVTESPEPDLSADINIHVPFHTLAGLDRGNSKHIAVYTHCNMGAEGQVQDACRNADIVTAMSFHGRDELLELGVDPKKIWVNYCAADEFHYRKRLVGIVGYPQPNGRKREGLLLDLAWQYDLSPYEFILTGTGWEGMAERLRSLGVSCSWHHADTFDRLYMTMRLLDVLLVTGYREGGPLPLLECMSAGVPVLSPDFGYASDLLDAQNIYKSSDDLMEKLDGMFEKSFFNHKLIRSRMWADYASEFAMLIGKLLNDNMDLSEERGMSRYSQLLDIIDEIKPEYICEIGTWNGIRAIQMIQAASRYRSTKEINYQGFDLFETQTGEQYVRELSKHGQDKGIVQKRIDATGANVELVEGDTKDTIAKLKYNADLYFVDGGHSERTIANDGQAVINRLNVDAVAVFDDYYHEGKPDGMGCNKFIDALDENYEITHLPVRTKTADGRIIGMVKVKHAAIPVSMSTVSYTHTVPLDKWM